MTRAVELVPTSLLERPLTDEVEPPRPRRPDPLALDSGTMAEPGTGKSASSCGEASGAGGGRRVCNWRRRGVRRRAHAELPGIPLPAHVADGRTVEHRRYECAQIVVESAQRTHLKHIALPEERPELLHGPRVHADFHEALLQTMN